MAYSYVLPWSPRATGYHPVLRSTQGSQSQDAPKPGPTELSPEAATCSMYGNPHWSPGIFSLLWGPPALSLQGQVSSHPMALSLSHGDQGRQAGEGPPHRSRVETLQLGVKASGPCASVFTHQRVPHTGVCPRAHWRTHDHVQTHTHTRGLTLLMLTHTCTGRQAPRVLIHSSIQMINEHISCVRHSAWLWSDNEQNKTSCPQGADILEAESDDWMGKNP